jgi:PAP2 superfamily
VVIGRGLKQPKLPRGRLDAFRQVALVVVAYALYRLVRGQVAGDAGAALARGRELVSLERELGLFFEPALQAWALSHPWLMHLASLTYLKSHFVITTGFIIWVYLARNAAYPRVRNAFMAAMAFGLAGYYALPTAPPRLLPELAMSDTVAELVGPAAVDGVQALYNPWAALPSMHVAFALLVAAPALTLVRARLWRALWVAYPPAVTFVVVITGNHYWLDAALGVVVAAVAATLAYGVPAGLGARRGQWQGAGATA